MKQKTPFIPTALLAGLLAAAAGTLEAAGESNANFEAGPVSVNGADSSGGCLYDPLFSDFARRVYADGLFYGSACSWLRMNPEAAQYLDIPDFTTREWGESLIPVMRFDGAYHWVESDIHAFDMRFEAGYGPFAASVDRIVFDEHDSDKELTLTRWHGLLRMSFDAGVEVDMGFGALTIEGKSENDRFSFTLPIRYRPPGSYGIEFRPAWSEQVSEYDLALLAGYKYIYFKAGYRWLRAPGEALDGPYAGLSISF
ncbi:MAG: hypothetical protein R6X19_05115 [Kiritimatiellia bacterium]